MPVKHIFKSDTGDRGVSLTSYALLVSLIGIVSFAAVSAVGTQTSDDFSQITLALGGAATEPTTTTTTAPLSPQEKWEEAQAEWESAIDAADAKHAGDMAAAKAQLDQARAANASLPKAEKKTANQQATAEFKAASDTAKAHQKASKQAANDAKAAAKAEYLATK
jgi:Flp pilus assembly pilin Flp